MILRIGLLDIVSQVFTKIVRQHLQAIVEEEVAGISGVIVVELI